MILVEIIGSRKRPEKFFFSISHSNFATDISVNMWLDEVHVVSIV